MCGLVGVAGRLEFKDEELMKRLLCHDYWRGKDSTGLASVRDNGDCYLAKVASDPLELFENARFKTALSGYNSMAFIDHNRAATKGKVNKYNAHPFSHDHIIGAHNGTLTTRSWRDLEDATGEKFEVDSEALIHAIAKLGIKQAIEICEEGRSSHDGAWALTWYDREKQTLNFLRNKWRPFWYAYSKDHKKVYWASEYWMIDAACHTMGFELATLEGKDGKNYRFFATDYDTHYEFDLAKLKAGGNDRPKPKACIIKGKEVSNVYSYNNGNGGYDPFQRGGLPNFFGTPSSEDTSTSKKTTISHGTKSNTNGGSKTNSPRPKDAPVDQRAVLLAGTATDPFAGLLTKEAFEVIAQYGCNNCSATIEWGDVGITVYERDNAILCSDCSSQSADAGKEQNRLFVRDIKPFL